MAGMPYADTPFDLKDPSLYEADRQDEFFTLLRDECPVYWNPEEDGPGFWSLTKYDDIVAASKNPKLFSSARDWGGHRIFDEKEAGGAALGDAALGDTSDVDTSMISMDPPIHNAYRGMVTPGFTPPRIKDMESRIRGRVRDILGELDGVDHCDFVTSVAAELPIQVLAELFGIPQEDRLKLFEWSNAMIGEDDPELRPSDEFIAASFAEMSDYAMTLWQDRLENPGDDLISMLAHGRIDGELMTPERYIGTFILLVVGGNETTRQSIAGGMLALSQNPDQLQMLLDDPSLIPTAVNEIIRWVSPVLHMRRTATEDTEIRGQKIAKGDKVVMWYVSANRDEEKFPDPFTFDVTRKQAMHLGFGIGQHFCLGSRLAELQLRLLFEELLPRYPNLQPTAPVRRVRSNFIRGIKEMQVDLNSGAT
jgi:linalool 8-monooxygenase